MRSARGSVCRGSCRASALKWSFSLSPSLRFLSNLSRARGPPITLQGLKTAGPHMEGAFGGAERLQGVLPRPARGLQKCQVPECEQKLPEAPQYYKVGGNQEEHGRNGYHWDVASPGQGLAC
jgi:hypothetical protein